MNNHAADAVRAITQHLKAIQPQVFLTELSHNLDTGTIGKKEKKLNHFYLLFDPFFRGWLKVGYNLIGLCETLGCGLILASSLYSHTS